MTPTIDRYQRHGLIDWFDQKRLREARVVVVGAGATGNEVLKNLTLLGVGHIHVFDFDKIEAHNLTRCVLFRESDVDKYKADVAASACRQIDPNVQIVSSNMDFWDGLSLEEVSRSEAVACCVDNYEARIRLNQLCLMTGTDFYNIGIDSRYASVEVFPFSTNPDCACFECTLPASAYATIQNRYSCGWLRRDLSPHFQQF
jgi:molybdopterin/thiamine biosynthesis adenylyltransferase